MKRTFALTIIVAAVIASSNAATVYVPDQYQKIQGAINNSINGDTVVVAPGRYYENVIINDKDITVISSDPNDPNIVAATIIDGNDANSVIRIVSANVTIRGFTITHGFAQNGGGMFIVDSNTTAQDCNVVANKTKNGITVGTGDAPPGGDGAGIYCKASMFVGIDCRIISNVTGMGGGAYIDNGRNAGNGGRGAGIFSTDSSIFLTRTTVTGNTTGTGGGGRRLSGSGGDGAGIYSDSNVAMANCIISHNKTGSGTMNGGYTAGNGGSGGGICSSASVTLLNSLISNNSTGGGGRGQDGWGGNGGDGGGIYCSFLTASHCTITDNFTGWGGYGDMLAANAGYGGGVFMISGQINDCVITRNATGKGGGGYPFQAGRGGNGGNGGGVYCKSSDLEVHSSKVIINRTGDGGIGGGLYGGRGGNGGNGGGLFCFGGNIVSTLIADNLTGKGGNVDSASYSRGTAGNGGNGGGITGNSILIANCNVANNITGQGGIGHNGDPNGIHGQGAAVFTDHSTVITNTIVWNNSMDQLYGQDCNKVSYSDIASGLCSGGTGNISLDPLFADANNIDPNKRDYHLQSYSPCINTGDPNYTAEPNETDIDGNQRIIGSRIDMGADEYLNAAPAANAGSDQIIYAWINGKANIILDGSRSSDADEDAISYKWIWEINGKICEAKGVRPCFELPVGVHKIQLVVNDGVVDSEIDDVNVTVIAALEGKLKITPQTINRRSNQAALQAVIELPDNVAANDVNTAEPLVLYPGEIVGKADRTKANGLICVSFGKDALMTAAPASGQTKVTAVGKLKSGQYFFGTAKITIIH